MAPNPEPRARTMSKPTLPALSLSAARLATASLLASAVLLTATAARADVVIGVALPRTGPVASIGDQVLNGVTAAVLFRGKASRVLTRGAAGL